MRNFISIFGRSVQVVWPDQTLGDVNDTYILREEPVVLTAVIVDIESI